MKKVRCATLNWTWLNEIQHEIRTATGEMAEVSKNQPAIALKVTTLAVAEKKIGFQDLEFTARINELNTRLVEHIKYLEGQSGDPAESLIKSKEFMRARDCFYQHDVLERGQV